MFETVPSHSHESTVDQPPTPSLNMVAFNCTRFSTSTTYWFSFSGSLNLNCYYISSGYYSVNWFEANDECRAMNSTLVSIHDLTTNYLLSHRNSSESLQIFWTGLNSLTKRGVYKWTDNSPVQYQNFTNVTSNEEPIPLNFMDQGRCVSFKSLTKISYYTKKYQGAWFKDDCNNDHGYICQKSPDVGTLPTPAPLAVGNCPSDWFQYANQKCIYYINVSMTFNKSRDLCLNKYGGELLSIHSKEEQNFITAYTAGLPSPYIGLIKKHYYASWIWDDNKRVDFTNWGVGNNYHSNKYCTSIITNDTQPGKWIKTNCSEKHTVICEKPLDPSITTPGQSYATSKCKIPGFDNFVQYRNSCYSVLDSISLSYPNAEKSCQSMKGSHLVSIVDPFEEAFLVYFIKQYGMSDMYWIGLNSRFNADTNVSQLFEWIDDWPVYYTNWDRYEPQFAGLPQEECDLFAKSNGTWRTSGCAGSHPYICKTTTNPLPKMNSDKSGVCPTLRNVTDKSQQWVDIDKRSQRCYWFSVDRTGDIGLQNWVDSSFHCRQRNGTLVSIHSKHDLLLLKNKLVKTGTGYNTWLGLSSDPNGGYVWEDGSALEYTNWNPSEKISSKHDINKEDSNRQCVEVKGKDLMWKQQSCSRSKDNFYICEVKKIYQPHENTQNTGQTSTKIYNQGSTINHISSKYPNSNSTHHPKKGTTPLFKQRSTKDPILMKQHSNKNTGMSGEIKAGIAFGTIGGVILLLAFSYLALKRYRPNLNLISSDELEL